MNQCPAPPGWPLNVLAMPPLLALILGVPTVVLIFQAVRRRAWPHRRSLEVWALGIVMMFAGYLLAFGVAMSWSDALTSWQQHLIFTPGCYVPALGSLILWLQYFGAALMCLGWLILAAGMWIISAALNSYVTARPWYIPRFLLRPPAPSE